jgi:hypothetical protein
VARVKPGRPGLLGGGITVASLGVAGMSIAGYLFLQERSRARLHDHDDPELMIMAYRPNYAPATAVLISGALAVAGGLAMIILSRTRIAWSQRATAARRRLAKRD